MRLSEAQYARLQSGKPRRQRNRIVQRSEAEEQEIVIQWARLAEAQYPALALLFHVPNGGERPVQAGVAMKRAGTKAGVPDLVLPVASGGYHGLFIELKAQGGRLAPAQDWWLSYLRSNGYKAVVCVGADEAIRTIETYLGGS